tara:strand:- start:1114 stop:1473 length:360 start_codon:yes stop_codon:yes gene_type:complete
MKQTREQFMAEQSFPSKESATIAYELVQNGIPVKQILNHEDENLTDRIKPSELFKAINRVFNRLNIIPITDNKSNWQGLPQTLQTFNDFVTYTKQNRGYTSLCQQREVHDLYEEMGLAA